MSYQDMPLYVRSYALTKNLFERSAKFPRHFRASIGSNLQQASLHLTIYIMNALLQPKTRAIAIDKADKNLNELRVCLRLSRDLLLFTENQHSYLAKEIAELGALLGSWKKREQKLASNELSI